MRQWQPRRAAADEYLFGDLGFLTQTNEFAAAIYIMLSSLSYDLSHIL